MKEKDSHDSEHAEDGSDDAGPCLPDQGVMDDVIREQLAGQVEEVSEPKIRDQVEAAIGESGEQFPTFRNMKPEAMVASNGLYRRVYDTADRYRKHTHKMSDVLKEMRAGNPKDAVHSLADTPSGVAAKHDAEERQAGDETQIDIK